MATFILICRDKPGALDLRMATREAHLAWVGANMAQRRARRAPCWTDAGGHGGVSCSSSWRTAAPRSRPSPPPIPTPGRACSRQRRDPELAPDCRKRREPGAAAPRDPALRPGRDRRSLARRDFYSARARRCSLGFVVRRGETVAGYVDRCPHAGMPLAMAS